MKREGNRQSLKTNNYTNPTLTKDKTPRANKFLSVNVTNLVNIFLIE